MNRDALWHAKKNRDVPIKKGRVHGARERKKARPEPDGPCLQAAARERAALTSLSR
ncbi:MULTISPECIES: hypothetical protein [Burkholderia cepacia complex]|uniref:hypothetical protein n=1 Tax=Burkholderia cepacia complex TaxID=87882 RepID=UPI001583CBC2|nr:MULTISPECIES: hypothetical protein [Burkholderia cepacia complex]